MRQVASKENTTLGKVEAGEGHNISLSLPQGLGGHVALGKGQCSERIHSKVAQGRLHHMVGRREQVEDWNIDHQKTTVCPFNSHHPGQSSIHPVLVMTQDCGTH